ncbi:MAG: methionyl-tRNA synthetase [Parcubacteria group bacterium Gr01-1014_29]|nr:MAG: methionyl-tRNA synthetase [Parcubacteria group bacterium Gr01-1014_29]
MPKFYITTSIPYVNAPPHMGHALEFVQADAIARWRRLQGDDVFFLTGTDEHGAKISRAAADAGKNPREFANANAKQFGDLIVKLSVSPNASIRTSDQKHHWPGAEDLWRRIAKNGDIYKGTYKGLYCVGHEAFVTEKDLKGGICEDHGKKPERIEEINYFFRLSEYGDEIKKRIETGDLEVLPEKRKNEVLAFLAEGTQDISFSRPAKDIPWGIPVPGDSSQTMYVWCDALSNYTSALGFGGSSDELFKKYWPADMHVVGKDIVRFHAVIWPAMLLSAGLPLPKRLFVHGFIHSGGKKMSKTLGNVIDPFSVLKKYGTEAVRYVLLSASVFEDNDLTPERIHKLYTAHLANGIGNLVSRIAAMAEKYFEGKIARPSDVVLAAVPFKTDIDMVGAKDRDLEIEGPAVSWFIEHKTTVRYRAAWEEYRIHDALHEVMELERMLDRYIQDYEPYKLIATDRKHAEAVLWNVLLALGAMARFLLPLLPGTAHSIAGMLGVDMDAVGANTSEYVITKTSALFPRIE